jgi:[ribosomal protein S5]-alanine N-acetyltransferase
MTSRPTLRTARLVLRPFTPEDAPAVEQLAGAYEIALNTLMIPHPYPPGAAAQWIGKHQADFDEDRMIHFALDDGQVAGAMVLVNKGDGIAEIGYWVGVPFWGRGYASEAARAVVKYGFDERGLHRIYAQHFVRNPASGRVLQNVGMIYEGTLRHHIKKWDEYIDVACYGILSHEFLGVRRP